MARVILDCSDIADLQKALDVYLANHKSMSEGDEWGYWSAKDEKFSAFIRVNKASVSIKTHRNP